MLSKMNKRTALVFGSTGLVGNLLLEELVDSERYSAIRIFVRQSTGISVPRVEEIIADFSDLDDLFICLGTTIKKAGSVENMEKIDRDLPVKIAQIALSNGVKNIAAVSSIGASADSKNYYLRIKGEMEEGIMMLDYENIAIVRPSMLLGERKERRTGELVGKVVMKTFRPLLTGKLRKYRAIHGKYVARAMIIILEQKPGKKIYESDELQDIVK
jgi:uncharacterized protein YbjT (DUF2867 family)